MWEKNQKIIDNVNEKIFPPGIRIGKEKPRLVESRETYLRKDLFERGLI